MEAVERHFTTAQVVRRGEVDAQLLPGRRIHAQLIGKFPDAETNLLRIGTDSVLLDRQLQRIEFLRPVAVGPPQAGLLNPQGRALGRRAVHRAGLPGSEIDRQRETDTAVQSAAQHRPAWFVSVVRNLCTDRQVGIRRIGQRQVGDYLRVGKRHIACKFERHILPDADITVADAGNPVPAFGTDESRPVEAQLSSVGAPPRGFRLLVGNPRVVRRADLHGKDVFGREKPGHIEHAPGKRPIDRTCLPAVQPHVGAVVDSIETQPDTVSRDVPRLWETYPVPPLRAAEAIGDGEVVEPVIGVGVNARFDQRSQHRSGNDGIVPGRSIVGGIEKRTVASDQPIRLGQFPAVGEHPRIRAGRHQTGLGRSLRFTHGLLGRCRGVRQFGLRLRAHEPEIGRIEGRSLLGRGLPARSDAQRQHHGNCFKTHKPVI